MYTNSLIKRHSPQTLDMHTKTVILLGIFHLVGLILLICQERFLFSVFERFLFFHNNCVFNVFYSWGQRFLHLWFILGHEVANVRI